MSNLSPQEITRYSRHIILPEVGPSGQEKLKKSAVLLIGAGGLGSPMALYLAAAGVGRIGIVDFDVVDESNLQRQILHGTSTLGKSKLDSAKARLEDLNPFITVEPIEERLTSKNALRLFQAYDVIADGTDNFATRYLVNDACVLTEKPNVYGSIFRFEGQLSVFNYQEGPCYRCLYPDPPPPGLVPSCAEGGVLGVLPGVVGCLQTTEVVKVLLGIGKVASGRLVIYDALKMKFRELKVRKDPNCPICGMHPSITQLIDYEQFCGIRPLANQKEIPEITVQEFKKMWKNDAELTLIDVREPEEYATSQIEGSVLIPLNTLGEKVKEWDRNRAYVIHCKSGGRSARATRQMLEMGFQNTRNLAGGILQWAKEIDPEMDIY